MTMTEAILCQVSEEGVKDICIDNGGDLNVFGPGVQNHQLLGTSDYL